MKNCEIFMNTIFIIFINFSKKIILKKMISKKISKKNNFEKNNNKEIILKKQYPKK